MTVEAQLTKSQFARLAILYHIQRKQFYFYALTAAVVSVVAVVQQYWPLLIVVWLPFIFYVGIGVFGAYRDGANKDNPAFLQTTYKFSDTGVFVSTSQGRSNLKWNQFSGWSSIAGVYVLTLKEGAMLAIPQSAVKSTQIAKFNAMLDKHINER